MVFVNETTQNVGALDRPTAIGVAATRRWWCSDVQVHPHGRFKIA
jgi:hypothetical protein